MILLDTCLLIDFVSAESHGRRAISNWINSGAKLCTAALCWSEFLTGPVNSSHITAATDLIEQRILAFGATEAALAADLYNLTGRRRGTRVDCFIAAVAINQAAELATFNAADFVPFQQHGLSVAEVGSK